MDEQLDNILEVAPEATRTTAITKAAEILQAEVISSSTDLIPVEPASVPAPIVPDAQQVELDEDMEYARINMKDVIDKGKAALDGALELAEAGDTARPYEVVGGVITAIIQANKELILLHQTRKETQKLDKEVKATGEATPTEIRINKAVFVGRAQDLLRSLNEIEKATKELKNG